MPDAAPFEGWCLLELMGHRRLAGYVREATVAGAGFVRIDVPGEDSDVATQFYAPGAVYAITPISEDVARRFAKTTRPEPVTRWELPPPVDVAPKAYTSVGPASLRAVDGDELDDNCTDDHDDDDEVDPPDA